MIFLHATLAAVYVRTLPAGSVSKCAILLGRREEGEEEGANVAAHSKWVVQYTSEIICLCQPA